MISLSTRAMMSSLYNQNLQIYLKELCTKFENEHDYSIFCESIINYILDDYTRANETMEIITEKNESKEMTIFQFLINLYMLEFNFRYKVDITSDWLWEIDTEFLSKYHKNISKLIKRIYDYIIDDKSLVKNYKDLNCEKILSSTLSSITERFERLTELLSPIDTPTIDLVNISNFCYRNKKFDELLNTTLDESKTTKELEIECKVKGEELKQIINDDKKSCLYPFIQSSCLNQNQLTQMFVAVGPRMTINNVVMDHVMKRSYLNGLENVGDLIAEGEIANKALIYKKKFVGVSGYMSRETNLLSQGMHIDFECDDCKTKHYINYNVKSDKHLDLILSKNIILPNGKLHMVTKNDTNLIGTTVKLRSIITCADTKPGYVCKKCYGNPLYFKRKMDIGGCVSIEVENKLSNAVMAVKHHTTTNTIVFNNEILLKYFNLEEGKLIFKRLDDKLIDNVSLAFEKEYIEDFKDRIKNDDEYDYDEDELEESEEDEDDIDSKSKASITSKIINNLRLVVRKFDPEIDDYVNEETEITTDGSFLVLSEEMMNLQHLKLFDIQIDSDDAYLRLDSLKPGMPVFNVKYITQETSKYLKDLKGIIERSKPNWWYDDLDTPLNNFADLVITAGLKGEEIVFLEPVLRALCRDPNNISKRPDFSKDDIHTVIVNLKTGIFEGNLYSALVYQQLTDTFENIRSFETHDVGVNDTLFKTTRVHDFDYMRTALINKKII